MMIKVSMNGLVVPLNNENKYITKHDLIKAKESFNKLYKKEECLTNGEYWSLIYMLKFIDLLIDEVK